MRAPEQRQATMLWCFIANFEGVFVSCVSVACKAYKLFVKYLRIFGIIFHVIANIQN